MSIEVGSKWVKDGEVVEVIEEISDSFYSKIFMINFTIDLILTDKKCFIIKADFLEQYKPYEQVYEYQYAFHTSDVDTNVTNSFFKDDTEFKKINPAYPSFQRLDFTKRERT